MSRWNHGLTPEQLEKVNAVLAEPRKYSRYAVGSGFIPASNNALEGWSMFRIPSTLNPPTIVRMRYRDGDGSLLLDIDCS